MKQTGQAHMTMGVADELETAKRDSKETVHEEKPAVDFDAIEESPKFQELVKAKKRFLIPSVTIFLALYILFPLIISYTNVLDARFIGDISWNWVYALGLFIMTWTLVIIYMKKAASFDKTATEVLNESGYGEGSGVR